MSMGRKKTKVTIVKRGNVFEACLGEGVGSEQSGFRPVVIIQNDVGNRHSTTVIVAPITSQTDKPNLPTHVKVNSCDFLEKNSMVILEQIRTIDKKRLKKFKGTISKEDMIKVDQAILVSCGITNTYTENKKIAIGV